MAKVIIPPADWYLRMPDILNELARSHSGNPDYAVSEAYRKMLCSASLPNCRKGRKIIYLPHRSWIVPRMERIQRRTGLTCFIPFAFVENTDYCYCLDTRDPRGEKIIVIDPVDPTSRKIKDEYETVEAFLKAHGTRMAEE